MPESIGQLTALTVLNMSSNKLTSVPESIGQLTALTGLYLVSNELTSVPLAIRQLPNLKNMLVSGNKLSQDAEDWLTIRAKKAGGLPELKLLDLARQASGVKGLEARKLTIEDGLLIGLDLRFNYLTSVPQSLRA